QSERMAAMGQTIATLSHHIKNILQGINGGSYLVQSGVANNEMDTVKTGWQIVEKNQAKISQLVMDMLSFSKERQPEMVEGTIESTVSDVVELLEHRAAENNVKLLWTPGTDTPTCLYDPEAIHRAVLNVASNGIDALETIENGIIEVSTRLDPESRQIEIWIIDNGPGIEPENLKKIFSVFESGKGQRGTGLGLPVSQKIMHEHGGDIRVESQTGQGSKFCLHFPLLTSLNDGQTNEFPEISH
ncbi:MAG: HAMP domain-containing sensor histidine kinase, partial [Planctomycetota bacterium]|nr:HAMP domain-containing sensor histidine kinase [Planctomycetota bacterium]